MQREKGTVEHVPLCIFSIGLVEAGVKLSLLAQEFDVVPAVFRKVQ